MNVNEGMREAHALAVQARQMAESKEVAAAVEECWPGAELAGLRTYWDSKGTPTSYRVKVTLRKGDEKRTLWAVGASPHEARLAALSGGQQGLPEEETDSPF
jgi:hypothetical protein